MSGLKLTNLQQQEVLEYLKFVRGQRTQTLRELQCTFAEICDSKVTDTTYSFDEIKGIIKELEQAVKNSMDLELMHHSHRHILLLHQYFTEMEKKSIQPKANFGVLDDGNLLQQVAKFEKDNLPDESYSKKAPSLLPQKLETEVINKASDEEAKELEVRVDKSTPVQNLKRIMESKNLLLQDYRRRIAKYEPDM
ncbi:Leucine zipper transcription factor-like protein 1 [Phlyctochytrium planicorne]|nr:Leucine zipper transcription factor-like protein 1 [Phlyctochytrium planicorne]